MDKDYMLTTIDNPYNPFTDFDRWYNFDVEKGYNTCSYIARVMAISPRFESDDLDYFSNEAIDEIIKLNVLGIYIKVTEEDADSIIAHYQLNSPVINNAKPTYKQ